MPETTTSLTEAVEDCVRLTDKLLKTRDELVKCLELVETAATFHPSLGSLVGLAVARASVDLTEDLVEGQNRDANFRFDLFNNEVYELLALVAFAENAAASGVEKPR